MSETADQRTRRVLREQGLPEGLLPAGILDADIDQDGTFAVTLPKGVEKVHGGYRVRYAKAIRGVLGQGTVRRLQGVDVKQMLWFPVGAIDAEATDLVFSVGPVRQPLPVSEFPLA